MQCWMGVFGRERGSYHVRAAACARCLYANTLPRMCVVIRERTRRGHPPGSHPSSRMWSSSYALTHSLAYVSLIGLLGSHPSSTMWSSVSSSSSLSTSSVRSWRVASSLIARERMPPPQRPSLCTGWRPSSLTTPPHMPLSPLTSHRICHCLPSPATAYAIVRLHGQVFSTWPLEPDRFSRRRCGLVAFPP